MKLTQLAAKPQLVKIELNDEEIVAEFGEALEFFVWDRQPMEKFISLAQMKTDDLASMIKMVNEMVLDEDGKSILGGDDVLPTNVMTKVIGKVVETLGK